MTDARDGDPPSHFSERHHPLLDTCWQRNSANAEPTGTRTGAIPMARLNVESLEGRALMSASVVAAVPSGVGAIVRVADSDGPARQASTLENTMVSGYNLVSNEQVKTAKFSF
jgi:hypothetical protein